jgi:hypothetical protein
MMKNDEYRKLFEALSDDEKPVLMNSIRKFVEDFEKSLERITQAINQQK